MCFQKKRSKISEVFEFLILPYTQNRKLGNCSFTSNFDSSCNLRLRSDKNELRQKRKVIKWIKKKKRKLPRFPSFRFCSIYKIKNQEISKGVLLLQILTVFVTFSKFVFSANRVEPCFFLSLIFPENFIKVPHVLQKIWRFSRSILIFSSIFWLF